MPSTRSLNVSRVVVVWLCLATLAGFLPGIFFSVEHALQLFLGFGLALGVAGAATSLVVMFRYPQHMESWGVIGPVVAAVCAVGLGLASLIAESNFTAVAWVLVYGFLGGLVPATVISYVLVYLQTGAWRDDSASSS